MSLIIGVDPGKSGGIVPLDKNGNPQRAWLMPQILGPQGGRTGMIDWNYIRGLFRDLSRHGKWIVALEDLADSTPTMAGRGKSMGTMIGDYHLLREIIENKNVGIPIHSIRSQTWQSTYGLNKGLVRRPPGSSDTMSEKEKRALARERRDQRERRMYQWANNEWPWAAKRFIKTWESGTIAAAMIGRHEYEVFRRG